MKGRFNIPPQLAHLKLDERGYPIPYFVPMISGKPNFRYQDPTKRNYCIYQKLCSICGANLRSDDNWIVTGPGGYKNQVTSDAPMHLVCAKFSMEVCPHIHFEKAERKEEVETYMNQDKPAFLLLVRIKKIRPEYDPRIKITLLYYKPIEFAKYEYKDNILVQADNNDL